MIISHKHRFIFVKTFKTGSTSVEIALSKFCGPRDVITSFHYEDERLREQLGYPGPQNYWMPLRRLDRLQILQAIHARRRPKYRGHTPGSQIRRLVGPETWHSYFKFCFERNPWDKAVSLYYWRTRNCAEPPTISDFIQAGGANPGDFELYTDRSEIILDEVYRFEQLGSAMEQIAERLNLPEVPALPKAKGEVRLDRRSYRQVLSEADKEKIARVFAREIAFFGYEW